MRFSKNKKRRNIRLKQTALYITQPKIYRILQEEADRRGITVKDIIPTQMQQAWKAVIKKLGPEFVVKVNALGFQMEA
jgi:hypothetical protein